MNGLGYKKIRKRVRHCHPLVASTAIDIVMASFEVLMSDNLHYAMLKNEARDKLGREATSKELEQHWLERNWGKGVEAARHTLARMLDPAASPGLDNEARERIHEALILDASLRMGRRGQDQFKGVYQ